MADTTNIEWCDSTVNFWDGCTEVSKEETGGGGCDHCYAKRMNQWLHGGENWGPGAPRRRILTASRTTLSWQRNAAKFRAQHGRDRRVFVNSTSDWLDNEVPVEWRVEQLDIIRKCPDVTFLLLSKRIGNFEKLLRATREAVDFDKQRDLWLWITEWYREGNPPKNVWVGATVVNQSEADRDIPKLLSTPARVRFLSIEPMLGPVDLRKDIGGTLWIGGQRGCGGTHRHNGDPAGHDEGQGTSWVVGDPRMPHHHHDNRCGRGIDWVITGGESGRGARPPHPDWFRSLRDQCAAAGVAFMFKQWGAWAPYDRGQIDGATLATPNALDAPMQKYGKKLTGRLLDGVQHNQFPEVT